MNTSRLSSINSWNIAIIHRWKVAGALHSPKGIPLKENIPYGQEVGHLLVRMRTRVSLPTRELILPPCTSITVRAIAKNDHPKMMGTDSSSSISKTTKLTGKMDLLIFTNRLSQIPIGYLRERAFFTESGLMRHESVKLLRRSLRTLAPFGMWIMASRNGRRCLSFVTRIDWGFFAPNFIITGLLVRDRRRMRGGVWWIACSGPKSSCDGHSWVVKGSFPSKGSENMGEFFMHNGVFGVQSVEFAHVLDKPDVMGGNDYLSRRGISFLDIGIKAMVILLNPSLKRLYPLTA
nr:hypothetical protein [Tanacetum cinerariifolium]